MRGLGDYEPRRLCFEEYVLCQQHPLIDDYLQQLNLSCDVARTMMNAMKRAMDENVQEPEREEEEEGVYDYATHEQHKGDDYSANSIILECIQTVNVCRKHS
jgi:hypothetical protein